MIQVRKNFNAEVGKTVYTVEMADGSMLLPKDGVVSFNYDDHDIADISALQIARLQGCKLLVEIDQNTGYPIVMDANGYEVSGKLFKSLGEARAYADSLYRSY